MVLEVSVLYVGDSVQESRSMVHSNYSLSYCKRAINFSWQTGFILEKNFVEVDNNMYCLIFIASREQQIDRWD